MGLGTFAGTLTRIQTPKALWGTVQNLANGAPQTVCKMMCDETEPDAKGAALPFLVQFEVLKPPSVASLARVVWEVKWGHGGTQFVRTVYPQRGRLVFVGSTCEVAARIELLDGTPASPTSGFEAQVRAQISPHTDGQTRLPTHWNEGNGGSSFVAADSYALTTEPATLWRLRGVNSGTGAYVLLFDTAAALPPAGPPRFVVGFVATNGNILLENITSGQDFGQGIVVAASSTPGVFTGGSGAVLALDCETLIA